MLLRGARLTPAETADAMETVDAIWNVEVIVRASSTIRALARINVVATTKRQEVHPLGTHENAY